MMYLHRNKLKYLTILFFLLVLSVAHSQTEKVAGDPVKGKELFNANCAACHDLQKKKVGPALGGIVEKLQKEEGLGKDWLHKWIKNSQSLRDSGDKYAKKIFEENNQIPMPAFANLSEADVDNILAYTSNPPKEKKKEDTPKNTKKEDKSALPIGLVVISLVAFTAILVWMLFRVNALYDLYKKDSVLESDFDERVSIKDVIEKNRKVLYVLSALFALLLLYGLWEAMLGIDVNKGYKPQQPIYFSHKIHAGIQKIDCQMCHTSAKYGHVSGIPTTNICMNCHYSIQEYKGDYVEEGKSKEFYTKEIQKIYASSGFDKDKMAYTGEQKPIEWVRIHNMPDFVHFNHAQHVVAGGEAIKKAKNVEQVCYACHGRVDEMNVVQMANDFTMGWCIECHRTTQVDMNNGYNKAYYAKLHQKLVQWYGKGTKITVDAIGGLECAKCHY